MSILRHLFTHAFTIKATIQKVTDGQVTHELETLSQNNKGRFDPLGGSRQREFLGQVRQASAILFTDPNPDIKVGYIIVNEGNCRQYDVVRIDEQTSPSGDHHLEVYLEEKRAPVV